MHGIAENFVGELIGSKRDDFFGLTEKSDYGWRLEIEAREGGRVKGSRERGVKEKRDNDGIVGKQDMGI